MGKHSKKNEPPVYVEPIPDLYVTKPLKHPAQKNIDVIDASIRKTPIPPPEVTE
jgi:hypothetical protein